MAREPMDQKSASGDIGIEARTRAIPVVVYTFAALVAAEPAILRSVTTTRRTAEAVARLPSENMNVGTNLGTND
jgi:hypothetical protein